MAAIDLRITVRLPSYGLMRSGLMTGMHGGLNDYETDGWSYGPFAPLFAWSLALLTHSLRFSSLPRSAALIRSLARLLTHSLRSSWVIDLCL